MNRIIARCLLAVYALTLTACGKSAAEHPATAAAPAANFIAIARGRVDVEGGIVHVIAQRDGVIATTPGAIGDTVMKGDVLATLDATQAQIGVDMAKAELAQAEAQVAAMRGKAPALNQRVGRLEEATRAGASSGQTADDARQALVELNGEISIAHAGIEAARQKLKQAEYEAAVRSVRAPVGGRLIARDAHLGDAVQAASVLAQLLPEGPRIVRAELNEGFVAKVKVGMSAQVYSEADSAKTYAAHVRRIGDVFGPAKLAEEGQESIDARDVECILDLGESDLRVGQRVQVRFLADGQH